MFRCCHLVHSVCAYVVNVCAKMHTACHTDALTSPLLRCFVSCCPSCDFIQCSIVVVAVVRNPFMFHSGRALFGICCEVGNFRSVGNTGLFADGCSLIIIIVIVIIVFVSLHVTGAGILVSVCIHLSVCLSVCLCMSVYVCVCTWSVGTGRRCSSAVHV